MQIDDMIGAFIGRLPPTGHAYLDSGIFGRLGHHRRRLHGFRISAGENPRLARLGGD